MSLRILGGGGDEAVIARLREETQRNWADVSLLIIIPTQQ